MSKRELQSLRRCLVVDRRVMEDEHKRITTGHEALFWAYHVAGRLIQVIDELSPTPARTKKRGKKR